MLSLHVTRVARQRRRRRQRQGFTAPRLFRWVIAFGAGLTGLLLVLGVVLSISAWLGYRYYADQLPPPDQIVTAEQGFLTTIVYDRSGQTELYKVTDPLGGDRRLVEIEDISPFFLDATVAIEDASFYDNPGFDPRGIARALWNNLTGGQIQGGSTITQQLVRNVLLDPEERLEISADRKIKEVILAAEISRLYSKEQILEWYVNTNYYGGWAYGIEAASRQYFDKPASLLTLAEAAVVAAIPQNPLINPIDNYREADARGDLVLDEMVEQGFITLDEANAAKAEIITVKPFAENFNIVAPHFSLYARAEAEALLNDMGLDGADLVTRGGLRIYTTVDLDLQRQAECVTRTHVMRLNGADPQFSHNTSDGQPCEAAAFLPPPGDYVQRTVTNAAVVMLNAQTGEIVAMVGSVDYWDEGIAGTYNVATAQRQPASAFKPLVYTAAFLAGPVPGQPNGITAATMTYDVPIEFDNGGLPYTPVNSDRQYHGPMSLRDALGRSYNVAPVQVANLVGLGDIIRTAHRLGVNSLTGTEYGLALALGSGEVSLLDLTYAYNVFNLNGYMVGAPVLKEQRVPGFRTLNPTSILRIEDNRGNVLWQYGAPQNSFRRSLVLEPGIAYIMTDILADTDARYDPEFPTGGFAPGNPLELSRPAAAKTGTSNDNRDSWTIGYTPQFVAGAWMGNNNNASMNDIEGINGAAPIWHAVMEYAHQGLAVETWSRPETVVEQAVCETSGLLPTRHCPQRTELFFVDAPVDTRPKQQDIYWNTYRINLCNWRLATDSTPPDCLQERALFDYPPEARTWALDTGQELPPTQYDVVGAESPFGAVTIIDPPPLDRRGGVVDVRGNATDASFAYWRLDYGEGMRPDIWIQIGGQNFEPGRDLLLGSWDTTGLDDGALYTLRLMMVRTDNTLETSYVQVMVDNQPPEVSLSAPLSGQLFSMQEHVYVPVQANPRDNVQVRYVDFYLNGERFASSDTAPYAVQWQIDGPGEQVFSAIAYDAAGNSAESAPIPITIEP